MSDALVLVVLLGAGADPTAEGTLTAARRALGPDALVLAETSDPASDAQALAIGERVHARAVARVRWADEGFTLARLHVHVAGADAWEDDEIAFVPEDAPSERGRSIGYALASMVQRLDEARPRIQEPEAPATPPTLSSMAGPSRGAADRKADSHRSGRFDVSAVGLGALGGAAASAGGALGLRWWPAARSAASAAVGLRLAAGARSGELPDAGASARSLFAAAGLSYRVPLAAFEVGARADFLAHRLVVSRTHSGVETAYARWLGAVDILVEAGWSISPALAMTVGIGAELALGTTSVNVGGRAVADVPLVWGLAELGGRFRF